MGRISSSLRDRHDGPSCCHLSYSAEPWLFSKYPRPNQYSPNTHDTYWRSLITKINFNSLIQQWFHTWWPPFIEKERERDDLVNKIWAIHYKKWDLDNPMVIMCSIEDILYVTAFFFSGCGEAISYYHHFHGANQLSAEIDFVLQNQDKILHTWGSCIRGRASVSYVLWAVINPDKILSPPSDPYFFAMWCLHLYIEVRTC